jgi:hypothetical protein
VIFSSQLNEDEKSKVSSSTPHYLYHRGKPKRQLGTHTLDSARRARYLNFFTVQTVQCPTHCEWGPSPYDNNIISHNVVRQQGRQCIMHMNVKGVHVSFLFDVGIPTSKRCNAALCEQHKSDKELPSLVFPFSYRFSKYAFRLGGP